MSSYGQTTLGWPPGNGPWRYRKLSKAEVTSTLTSLANPTSIAGVDAITFQPYSAKDELANQDRYAVEEWDLGDGLGKWRFMAIFDGHAGHDTANYVVANLPSAIKAYISGVANSLSVTPDTISNALKHAISSFDDDMKQELLDLFPGGEAALSSMSAEDVDRIANDQDRTGGINYAKVARCMQGSTALIVLVDPKKENLWVASLGDCQAVLGVKDKSSWKTSILSADHNAAQFYESERIREQHPGELDCILRNRVLGGIAITRALGDHLFKLNSLWTTKVFMNARPGFQFKAAKPEDLIPRIRTPPYLSNEAEIRHVDLRGQGKELSLILCSDGLLDLDDARDHDDLKTASGLWMEVASSEESRLFGGERVYANRALRVLRQALGGDDLDAVSQMLTVEMEGKWLDDITVLVSPL